MNKKNINTIKKCEPRTRQQRHSKRRISRYGYTGVANANNSDSCSKRNPARR